jgi:hypothetical protein
MNLNITQEELMKIATRPLWWGEYEATEAFRAIEKHAAVCFEDGTLVAVTGVAGDRESQLYAALFADAPAMLLELARLRGILNEKEQQSKQSQQVQQVQQVQKDDGSDCVCGGLGVRYVKFGARYKEYPCPHCSKSTYDPEYALSRVRDALDAFEMGEKDGIREARKWLLELEKAIRTEKGE